jgi:hypothetical protein
MKGEEDWSRGKHLKPFPQRTAEIETPSTRVVRPFMSNAPAVVGCLYVADEVVTSATMTIALPSRATKM